MVRAFLIGCPRSGTTLVQALLTAHPAVLSFPESHLFTRGLGGSLWDRVYKRIVGGFHLYQVFHDREIRIRRVDPALPSSRVRPTWSWRETGRRIFKQLDAWAEMRECKAWIEKTPMHIWHIHQICRCVPDARFVHIIRDGRDVVASLYTVTRKYPEAWGGPRSLSDCVAQWNSYIDISLRCQHRPNHTIVCYETLLAQPERTLQWLCEFLGLEYDPVMISDKKRVRILDPEEKWKKSDGRDLSSWPQLEPDLARARTTASRVRIAP